MSQLSQVSCLLITLIRCLKGHKSLGSLCTVKMKSHLVSQRVSEWRGHLLSCSGHLKRQVFCTKMKIPPLFMIFGGTGADFLSLLSPQARVASVICPYCSKVSAKEYVMDIRPIQGSDWDLTQLSSQARGTSIKSFLFQSVSEKFEIFGKRHPVGR